MKNRINLIHDRAETPPTAFEKVSFTLPLIMICAYAATLGLAMILVQSFNHEHELLQRQLATLEELHRTKPQEVLELDDAAIDSIRAVMDMVRHYENRWEWSEKLQSLQLNIPDGIFLTSVSGEAWSGFQIKGNADDSDGLGMERVRNFVTGLEADERLGRRDTDVIWQSSRAVEAARGAPHPVLQFDILCRAVR